MTTIVPMQPPYEIEAIDLCEFQDYDKYNVFKGVDTGTRGIMFVDELIVNNTGDEIGA